MFQQYRSFANNESIEDIWIKQTIQVQLKFPCVGNKGDCIVSKSLIAHWREGGIHSVRGGPRTR